MRLRTKGGLFWLEFDGLSTIDGLRHAVFLRDGGRSAGVFRHLNIGRGIGDVEGDVAANRSALADALGFAPAHLVFARQYHGGQVCVVGEEDFLRSTQGGAVAPRADALVTRVAHAMLTIQVADCQAVMIADPVKRVVANVHSGWRGSIQNIIGNTVQEMRRRYGSEPADLMAGVGPSLGPCCGEFIHYKTEIPSPYWQYRVDETRFDFWRISRDQLTVAGLQAGRVELARICTRCNPHLFYSYRAERTTGRFGAVIGFGE